MIGSHRSLPSLSAPFWGSASILLLTALVSRGDAVSLRQHDDRLLGVVTSESIDLRTAYGEVSIPFASVKTVDFSAAGGAGEDARGATVDVSAEREAVVYTVRSDRFRGTLLSRQIHMRPSLSGEPEEESLEIDIRHIAAIEMDNPPRARSGELAVFSMRNGDEIEGKMAEAYLEVRVPWAAQPIRIPADEIVAADFDGSEDEGVAAAVTTRSSTRVTGVVAGTKLPLVTADGCRIEAKCADVRAIRKQSANADDTGRN